MDTKNNKDNKNKKVELPQETNKKNENFKSENENNEGRIELLENEGRRGILKSLAVSIPVIGTIVAGAGVLSSNSAKTTLVKELMPLNDPTADMLGEAFKGKTLNIGVIGVGGRGKQLMEALGYYHPDVIEKLREENRKNPNDTRIEEIMLQEKLNIKITAVCDIFNEYEKYGMVAGSNSNREGKEFKQAISVKAFNTYQELIDSNLVDAVVITTPDHWHGTMAIYAAQKKKHIFLEKPATWTVEETYLLEKAVKDSGVIFQLAHQNRQVGSHIKAKEIIDRGLIGKVTLAEMTTNRNDPNGAWVYDIDPKATPENIKWEQYRPNKQREEEYMNYMKKNKLERYVGPDDYSKFSAERFFRWRCWWDYSTGLSGDLLTHEYDAINQIMGVGIPTSAMASGGVYFFKDGRTVPDVLHVCYEFKDDDFTMLYSATQANDRYRGKVIMGHDGSLEIGKNLVMKVDARSTKYKKEIESGIIKPDEDFYTYIPGRNDVDAVTTATEKYFAQRGLLYSYVGNQRVNTTFLHLREWLMAVEKNVSPSCNIDVAFQEAITAHMSTRAYLEGRIMFWDKQKREIVKE